MTDATSDTGTDRKLEDIIDVSEQSDISLEEAEAIVEELSQIDPNDNPCPFCGNAKIWKGRHASAQHPKRWEAFKNYFERTNGSARWVEP
jgi:hypothetical protein